MIARENIRFIPNKGNFVNISDSDKRTWHFKVPSALQGAKILKSSEQLIAGISNLKNSDMSSILNVAKNAGPEVLSIFGVIIGISWHSAEFDLVAKKSDHKDLMDYGEAVFEELHEENISLEDIILMATAIGKVWWENNSIQQEAMDRLGFSSLMKE